MRSVIPARWCAVKRDVRQGVVGITEEHASLRESNTLVMRVAFVERGTTPFWICWCASTSVLRPASRPRS